MASPNIGELLVTTLRYRSQFISDIVTNSNAILRQLSQNGRIRLISGGRDINLPLEYSENSSFG